MTADAQRRTREARLREGVPLPDSTWEALVEAGRALGVEVG